MSSKSSGTALGVVIKYKILCDEFVSSEKTVIIYQDIFIVCKFKFLKSLKGLCAVIIWNKYQMNIILALF